MVRVSLKIEEPGYVIYISSKSKFDGCKSSITIKWKRLAVIEFFKHSNKYIEI